MSDLRAAAERYRGWCNGRGEYMSMGDAGKKLMESDIITLADAHLAEHPADDGEPVTGTWLMTLGFQRYASIPGFGHSLVISNGWELLFNPHKRWLLRNDYLPCQPKTRGDVRRLLKALGVAQ